MNQHTPAGRSTIVVGTDGSRQAHDAVEWAARWAQACGESLHVVMVRPQINPAWDGSWTGNRDEEQQTLTALATIVEKTSARHRDLTITHEAGWTKPAGFLVEQSRAAYALVVGTRGRGGWAEMLSGSVSAEVSTHAQCPVVIVPDEVTGNRRHGPIVWGLDGSAESRRAGRFAFDQAGLTGSPVRAINSWQPSGMDALAMAHRVRATAPTGPDNEALVDSVLTGLGADFPGVEASGMVIRGDAVASLASASKEASLVVVGSRGLGGFTGLMLGSVSRALIYLAECPVAIVR